MGFLSSSILIHGSRPNDIFVSGPEGVQFSSETGFNVTCRLEMLFWKHECLGSTKLHHKRVINTLLLMVQVPLKPPNKHLIIWISNRQVSRLNHFVFSLKPKRHQVTQSTCPFDGSDWKVIAINSVNVIRQRFNIDVAIEEYFFLSSLFLLSDASRSLSRNAFQ